jgi:hypothetical protein
MRRQSLDDLFQRLGLAGTGDSGDQNIPCAVLYGIERRLLVFTRLEHKNSPAILIALIANQISKCPSKELNLPHVRAP